MINKGYTDVTLCELEKDEYRPIYEELGGKLRIKYGIFQEE